MTAPHDTTARNGTVRCRPNPFTRSRNQGDQGQHLGTCERSRGPRAPKGTQSAEASSKCKAAVRGQVQMTKTCLGPHLCSKSTHISAHPWTHAPAATSKKKVPGMRRCMSQLQMQDLGNGLQIDSVSSPVCSPRFASPCTLLSSALAL